MNAERLHAIAFELRKDLQTTNAPGLIASLSDGLKNLAQNPSDASYQQQVAERRAELERALQASASNDFSPAWREAVEELGVSDLLGNNLHRAVDEILQRHEAITPSAASEELTSLASRVEELNNNLEALIVALHWFEIGSEELEFGQFEVGVLIPRAEVKNELGPLAEEFVALRKILLPFVELTTGSRPDFEVRSLSSSEFQIFLDSPGAAAACIALAIERLVKLYEGVLNIRLARKQLEDTGMTGDQLTSVTEHADGHMEKGIGELVDELIEEFASTKIDEGRTHELRMELHLSLNGLANRIDRSFQVEVRTGLPEPEEESEEGQEEAPEVAAARQHAQAVLERQEALQFKKLEGSPILSLEEPPRIDIEDGDDSEPAT